MVAGKAHCPAVGVKVKVKVPAFTVEIVAGLQTPVYGMLLVELAGRAGATPLIHKSGISLKVDCSFGKI